MKGEEGGALLLFTNLLIQELDVHFFLLSLCLVSSHLVVAFTTPLEKTSRYFLHVVIAGNGAI